MWILHPTNQQNTVVCTANTSLTCMLPWNALWEPKCVCGRGSVVELAYSVFADPPQLYFVFKKSEKEGRQKKIKEKRKRKKERLVRLAKKIAFWREGGDWKCETRKWSTKMLLIAMRSSTLSKKSNPLYTVFFSDTVYKCWTCCARRTWFTSTPRSALSRRCIISCSQSSCRMLTTHPPSRTRL